MQIKCRNAWWLGGYLPRARNFPSKKGNVGVEDGSRRRGDNVRGACRGTVVITLRWLEFTKQQRTVGAAEAKGIGHGNCNRHRPRGPWDQI